MQQIGFAGFTARIALAATLLLGAVTAAPAQGLFGLGAAAQGGMECFSTEGHTVRVERFDPCDPCGTGRFPAIVLLYGTDGMDKYGTQVRAAASQLADNGFAAFIVYYFDGPGGHCSGTSMADISPAQFRAWVRTVKAGISHAQAQPNVRANRIGIAGFSLGSAVGLSVAATDARVDAIVDAFGALPAQYRKHAANMPPTLIVHGECDEIVPVAEAYSLANLLRRNGVPHDIVVYAGRGHTLDARSLRNASERGLVFFRTYLR